MHIKSTKTDRNNRIQLSLAASMFFAPFVKSLINKGHFDLSQEDRAFIQWYIRLGFLTIGALLVTIGGAIAMYFFTTVVFVWIYRLSTILLVILLLLGTLGTLANIKILQEDQELFHYQKIKNDKSDIFLSFLPVYNIYLRYKLHDFDHPYWRAKESLLWRTLFILIALWTRSAIWSWFILTIIIIRVASLMSGIDIFDEFIKKKINKLYHKNPEELWWYIRGFILFWIEKLKRTAELDKKLELKNIITQEKEKMQHLFTLQNKAVVAQYFIALALLAWWFSIWLKTWSKPRESRVIVMTIVLILWRYVLMVIKRKHIPNIPIAKEIVDTSIYLYHKFISKKTKATWPKQA